MRIYTAPEEYIPQVKDVTCFLAGGITDCWNWQQAVIEELEKYNDVDYLVLFNPRRDNFPIDDSNAAQEQIEWEFKYLNMCNIFSMYFCNSTSTQPICMYELGRHATRQVEHGKYNIDEPPEHLIVAVENGYSRAQDVYIQMSLLLNRTVRVELDNPFLHAAAIYRAYQIQLGIRPLSEIEEEFENACISNEKNGMVH